ncbi:MAG: YggS family pyridoxal phosphate-dependent enzyme [Clostridia bacterium]|nr:YggS family pyridoxal phosphate-dependent enzyme [Clostridia bacterium]
MIKTNLDIIKANVKKACDLCGRNPDDVLILAVTKNHTADEINRAIDLGITDIGENRVQELLQKYDDVKKGVRWHIIGHLQTNKVKYIADKVCMIHSVDSVKLALEIDKQCKKLGKVMDILIEINSGEENKNGIEPSQAYAVIEEVSKLQNVCIKGLMTMAPLGADDSKLKEVFSSLYNLSVDIAKKKYDNVFMEHLSMGMSGDYMAAIIEGATIIRPGRSLFGTAKSL